jgi:hypothetical protein
MDTQCSVVSVERSLVKSTLVHLLNIISPNETDKAWTKALCGALAAAECSPKLTFEVEREVVRKTLEQILFFDIATGDNKKWIIPLSDALRCQHCKI